MASKKVTPAFSSALLIIIIGLMTQNTVLTHGEEDDENIKILLQSETLLSVSEDYDSQRFPAHEDELTYLPNNRVPDKIPKAESLYPTDGELKAEFLYPTDENIHLRYRRDDSFSSGDIDECATDNGGCQHDCTNLDGSFRCECRTGFTLNSDAVNCSDTDECSTGNGGCGQVCTNTEGSYICACNSGFTLNNDDKTCSDINECNTRNGGCEQVCNNTEGSYTCSCNTGYTLNNDNEACSDTDECSTGNGGCGQVCTNTEGSYSCSCNSGFTINNDDKTCSDINECNTRNGGCEQVCNNTVGSYSCACNSGFTLNNDDKTCYVSDTLELFSFSRADPQLRGDDVTSPSIESEVGIPFGTNRYQEVYVGSNGIISFDTRYNSYTPRFGSRNNFVCPYWGDINQRSGGNIYYQVYSERSERDSFQLRQYTLHIAEYGGVSNFEAKWALQVTYDRVAPYQGSSAQQVTFQVVLVSNGLDTYALYVYKDRAMNWFERRGRVFIGHNDNGIFNSILYSGTDASFEIDRFRGNTGLRGFWIFKIGSAPSASRLCLNWYYRNILHFTQRLIRRLPRCPCNWFRLRFDWRWRFFGFRDGGICYRLRPTWRFWPSSKECCYDFFGRNIRFGQLAGSALAYNQRFFRRQHYTEDTLPRRHCCEQSNRYCYLYNRLRPAGFCTLRSRFRVFWVFGDPHINTLDGKIYVFNGLGEYTLMHVTTEDFVLQGRTDRAETANGTLSNATIFSAFAVRDNNGTTFQVELDQNKTGLIIYGNGRDLTSSFYERNDFEFESGGALSISRNGTKVTAVFSSGISLTITPGLKLLTISCTVPEDFMNSTRGLMGNFNNDVDDDFALPNGTVLSPNMTEREIYRDFGQQWMIDASESVFKYPLRKGPADFSFPEFVPVFLDEQPDDVKNQAYAVCGGQTNLACIYDFVATGNRALATETATSNDDAVSTNSENANTTPEIIGTTILNATVGEESSITVVGTDAEDGDDVTYIVVDQPDSATFSFNNQTNAASWTPSDASPVNISFVVQDSNNLQSPPLEVQVRLCDNCNNNGDCDHSRTRQALDEADNPSFQLVACICNTGWEGANCSIDIDGCADDPCLVGQTCTDRPAANHTVSNISYDCSPCPDGYSEQGEPPKCEDVNECNSTTTNDCEQVCENTDGGYTCSCHSGYRKQGFGTCNDINECDERISGCNQLCTNTDGSFNCSCRSGYILNADGKNCTSNTSLCESSNCTQGCSAVASDSTVCFCRIGYILNADNVTCDDEDECARNPTPCSQGCSNNVGGFECSCFPGYKLAQDGKTCEECRLFTYGDGCSKTCQCGTNGDGCDKVRGCICKTGWRGENCTTDIDECTEGTFNCTADTICDNTDGSYQCLCQSGYQKVNGKCEDINECNDDSINDCEQTCLNTNGSFSCGCTSGYRTSDFNMKQCVDIDECASDAHGCQQFCDNVEGSYNCRCEFGFQLAGDRKTCLKVEDVCATITNLNCSYACNVSLSGKTANCYCESGYRLANDLQTCLDIDECQNNVTNRCSDTCDNIIGSYSCSCPLGKKLENDERTCLDCDDSHWGENCANECGCGIGASRCDKMTGCVCKNGWQGDKCQQDVDECSTVGICPQLSTCRNTPGNYSCDCREGYNLISNTCQDIDECSSSQLNTCDTFCNNTVGSFICSCRSGFILRNGSCEDIDECENGIDNCEHTCRNEAGSFSCECRNGFRISDDDASRCVSTGSISCSLACENCELLNNGTPRCFCTRGFQLADNNLNCTDIDECAVNPCTGGNCTQGNPGEFTCACPAGFQLDADQVTCKECPQGTYGSGCSSTCDCFDATTTSCSNVNGLCSCVDGWQGTKCDEDKDECAVSAAPDCGPKASCLNTNGSFICKCNTGYFKSNNVCVECDDSHWGDNCQETCQCVAGHVLSCNKTDGTCNCNNQWNGNTCQTDVDECQNQTICGASTFKCVNFDGGFRCDCQDGYIKDVNGNCQDIDECVDLPCPQFETCSNTPGNYTCTCPTVGYYVVNDTCTDTDECATDNGGCQHDCTNLNGSFRCECRTGFTLNSDAVNCSDTDECSTGNGGCGQVCTNTEGSYSCACNSGFTLNNDDKTCSDINECNTSNGGCEQVCNNTEGSYICSCNTGYTLNNDNKTCSDIDECNTSNSGCEQVCNNTEGSYICSCNAGYTLINDNKTCSDIDECKNGNFMCTKDNEVCNNTIGSYECICDNGYENISSTCQDVDECKNGNFMCTKDNEVCNNTIGSYECICDNGYENISSTCQDVDECKNGNIMCTKDNEVCNNTIGSYECICDNGYENISSTCQDINECNANNGGCEQVCNNTVGSYICSCNDGYSLTNDNRTCSDIDECKNGNSMCAKDNEVCNNTIGSYECICDNGYENISSTCQDINECNANNGGCEQVCNNTVGSYICSCNDGYSLTNDNRTCSDVDECKNGNFMCTKDNEVCNNTIGSYECICDNGYENISSTCQDTDECNANNGGCEQVCNNTVGSYICSCNAGYSLTNDNRTCSDVDECKNGNFMCTKHNEVCNNTIGSYECICDNGYENISSTCRDINECDVLENGGCQHECRNLNGTFKCECRTGYALANDNKTCTDVDECKLNTCTRKNQVCENTPPGTYTCNCKPGFANQSDSCVDTDECSTGNGGCEQVCNNTDGSYSCSCNSGFTLNNDDNTCSEAVRTNMTLEVADTFNQGFIVDNQKNSAEFKELVKTFATNLLEYFRNQLNERNIIVIVFDINSGSLVIDYEVITSKLSSDQLSIAVKRLADGKNVTIGNQTYNVESLKVNGKPAANFSVCELYEEINGKCGDKSVCDTKGDETPYCRQVDSSISTDLIIGLGIGLPLFFLLLAVIFVLVYIKIKSRKKQEIENLVAGSANGYPFASSLPKRSSHTAANYMHYVPDGFSSVGSSSSSGTRPVNKKGKDRDDFRDSAWYTNGGTDRGLGNEVPDSNFSWDYLYRMLHPDNKFEIRRPKVAESPNPPFTQSKRQSAA